MNRNLIRVTAFVLLIVAVTAGGTARAHDFPSESVMNAFVRLEPDRLDLVIRVPLHLLGGLSFPANAQRELELEQAGPAVQRALDLIAQEIVIRDKGVPLVPTEGVGRLSLPSDRSFEGYDEAVRHITSPLAPGTVIYAEQGFVDAYFTYPISSPASDFTIQTTMLPNLKQSLKLVVRFMPLNGQTRVYMVTSLDGRVALDPRWYQAMRVFVKTGFFHILDGLDHLLFLLCLAVPFRRLRDLLPVTASFTVAHSVTLIASASGLVPAGDWFPALVETLIAASIVYMGLENIVVTLTGADLRQRWLVTSSFGFVHGFGFAYGLQQSLQFAGSHLLLSLLSFNAGIELGQVLVLLVVLPLLGLLFRYFLAPRYGVVILSALLVHTGWHWMLERAERLQLVGWPVPDAAAMVILARLALVVLLTVGAVWILVGEFERRFGGQRSRARGERAAQAGSTLPRVKSGS
ncbi:MAG TPA: hypothetical protein DEP84_29565 [Chloroflexi bacterium]|nr:hypothetical protein [Chloroflexota bacterium]